MGLRALVFSSDGDSTSAICHVLTDLGIEAEICSEMLVAVERVSNEPYDALLVDWDHSVDAAFLLKTQRDLKRNLQALALALVQNDSDLPAALQAGANSVIRKPVDARQAADTLSTAKQLILARQTDRREHEARLAAAQAIPLNDPAPHEEPEAIEEEKSSKTGFLMQTAPRSALEAEQAVTSGEPENSSAVVEAEPQPAPAPLPSEEVRSRALKILGYGDKSESDQSAPPDHHSDERDALRKSHSSEAAPQDSTRVFSSLPEPTQATEESAEGISRPRYGVYAAVAALLVAGVLWAFAPGDSYSMWLKHLRVAAQLKKPNAAEVKRIAEKSSPPAGVAAVATKSAQPVEPDPEITNAEDEDANKIQVIENKPIPIAGAQQPPSNEPTGELVPANPSDGASEVPAANAVNSPANVASTAPQLQPAAAQGSSVPTALPAVAQTSEASIVPAPAGAQPEPATTAPPEGHVGVIIPDSLRSSPQAAPASSFEPLTVSEETSRQLLIKKVDPDYPPQAMSQRLEGPVVLLAWVGTDGSIRDLKLVRGYFVLGRAAFEAVKQWRFKPYSQNGKAIDFQTYITVTFKVPS